MDIRYFMRVDIVGRRKRLFFVFVFFAIILLVRVFIIGNSRKIGILHNLFTVAGSGKEACVESTIHVSSLLCP